MNVLFAALLLTTDYEVTFDEAVSIGPFVVVDQDGDGGNDVALLTEKRLLILRKHGTEKAEVVWPAPPVDAKRNAFARSASEAGVTACDLDGDRALDFIFATPDGRLLAVNGKTLKAMAGFPIALPEAPVAPIVCGDWDKNDKPELFVAVKQQVFAFSANGAALPGFPSARSKNVIGLTLGAFSGDAPPSLVSVDDAGELTAQSAQRAKDKLFQSFGFRLVAAPMLADVDDDGEASLIGLGEDYGIHLRQAKPITGFPVTTGYRFYAPPALGDVDGDGSIDIVAANADGKVYAVSGKGKALAGFPAQVGPRFQQAPWLLDRDLDGKLDIALLAPSGQVLLRTFDGKAAADLVEAFEEPGKAPAQLVATDGTFQVYVVGKKLSMKEAPRSARGLPEQAVIAGGAYGNAGRTSRFGPNEARFKDVLISPAVPKTDDPLQATYGYFDLDGDAESGTEIRWYKNGKLVPELDNQRTVPPAATSKKDVFSFTLQDGRNLKRFGRDGALSRIAKSKPATIANTVPLVPGIALTPEAPRTDDTIAVTLVKPSTDADGDAVQYLYRWFKNREPQRVPLTQAAIDKAATLKGERWSVIVVATDGEGESGGADAEKTILDTAPLAPEVRLEPAVFDVTTPVHAIIAKPAFDADGDTIVYRHRWKVAGQVVNLRPNAHTLPEGIVHKNQDLELVVTPFDGEQEGAATTLTGKAKNALAKGLVLSLSPLPPRKGEALLGLIEKASVDPDVDNVRNNVAWLLNGQPYPAATGWSVPATALAKGQTWTLVVTPADDQEPGEVAKVSAKVVNTPPRGLKASISETRPRVTSKVQVTVITPGVDDDADAIVVEHEWRKNGVAVALPKDRAFLNPGEAKKGEQWTVTLTSRDAEQVGEKVTLGFTVVNTAPTAPAVVFDPAQPRSEQAVSVKLATPSSDDDRDKLTYRYRWFVDGVKTTWPENKDRLAAGEVSKRAQVRVEVSAFDGEVESAAGEALLQMQNTVPSAPVVVLNGKTVETPLECVVSKAPTDFDRDVLSVRYEWTLDGAPHSATHASVDAAMLRRGQKWTCRAQAVDGDGASPWSNVASVAIDNARPGAPVIAIETPSTTVRDDLLCVVATPSRDADGDVVKYRYEWKKKGGPESSTEPRLDRKRLRRGDTWTCAVLASDGHADAVAAKGEVTIANAAPDAPQIKLTPKHPRAGEQLLCELDKPASDPDGDKLEYRFVWFKDDVEQRFAATSASVPGRLVRAGEKWACEVVASDGTATATPVKTDRAHIE